MKRCGISVIFSTAALCAVFAASVAWEGRAVVGGGSLYPAPGMYGLSRVFSPGEIVEVLNPVNQKKVTVVVSGKSDLSGVLIVLSPEAAAQVGVTAGTDAMVRVTKIPEYAREPDILNKRDMIPGTPVPSIPAAAPKTESPVAIEEIPVTVPASTAAPEPKTAEVSSGETPAETVVSAETAAAPEESAELVAVPSAGEPLEKIASAPAEPEMPAVKDTAAPPVVSLIPVVPPVEEAAPVSQPITGETVAALESLPEEKTEIVAAPPAEAAAETMLPAEPAPAVAELAPPEEPLPPPAEVLGADYEIIAETTTYSLVETAPKPPAAESPLSEKKDEPAVPVAPPVSPAPEKTASVVIPAVPLEPAVRDQYIQSLKSGAYYVQLAFYKEKKSADALVSTYKNRYPVVLNPHNGGYQCLIGPLTASEYTAVLDRFKKNGFADAFVKKIP